MTNTWHRLSGDISEHKLSHAMGGPAASAIPRNGCKRIIAVTHHTAHGISIGSRI
jgi:hypothetical protein